MHTHAYKRQFAMDCFKVFDVALIMVAFLFAMAASNLPITLNDFSALIEMRFSFRNMALFMLFGVVWHLILNSYGFYDSRRLSKLVEEMVDIVQAITICMALLFTIKIGFPIKIISLNFLQWFWVSSFLLFTTSRLLLRLALILLRFQGRNLRQALIIGSNERALAYAQKLREQKKLGYIVLGLVDDAPYACPQGVAAQQDSRVVCTLADFQEYIRHNVIDEIFLFLPIKTFYSRINAIIAACEEQGIVVRMGTDFFSLKLAKARIERIDCDALVTLYTGNMYHWKILIKEIIDVAAAALLVLCTAPLMLAAALLIKVMSPGPVFFKQDRIGLNKRKFKILKFRTMVVDAEKKLKEIEHLNEIEGNVAFKLKNDPRITPVGKVLRILSLDELPQLFNVVRGDMSLVGPRPLTLNDFRGFSIDWQRRRFSVKPGITCLWQIAGRSTLTFREWMELDMEYIDNWSLWLDFKILLKTVPAVLKTRGAQ